MTSLSKEGTATKIVWWIVGALLTVALMLGSNAYGKLEAKTEDHSKRIQQLELNVAVQNFQYSEIIKQLNRMELTLEQFNDFKEDMTIQDRSRNLFPRNQRKESN